MRIHRSVILGMGLVLTGACSGGESAADDIFSGSIGGDEVNRFEIEFVGSLNLTHTGGLLCSVEDGDLVLDFSIDASDGEYEYGAVFPDFEPAASSLEGQFALQRHGNTMSTGVVTLAFNYRPAPDEYPGVVRAAGTLNGLLAGIGGVEVEGAYACFLMDSEVGG